MISAVPMFLSNANFMSAHHIPTQFQLNDIIHMLIDIIQTSQKCVPIILFVLQSPFQEPLITVAGY